jgi:fluoride exporter
VSDLDPDLPEREPIARPAWHVLTAIALGGVIGAELRWGAAELLPPGARGFPWATLLVNVVAGLGLGVLMAALARAKRPDPLVRPFLGIGILGGLSTFSTYSTDTYRLLDAGRPALAVTYAGLTLLAALAATIAGGALVGALASS